MKPAENRVRGRAFRLGLIVNPIAGLGGAVALKGTDGDARHAALRRGARPLAAERAARALSRIDADRVELFAGAGEMGEAVARGQGFLPIVVGSPADPTSAEDTVRATAEMRTLGVDLLLFAGGDGTARDVFSALGREAPMLGIPTGVKMQSAVFATSPENAGLLANATARGEMRMRDAELLDLDESLLSSGIVSPRLTGVARVPFERRMVQQAKCRAAAPEADLQAACAALAAGLEPDVVTLFGPGTTTQLVLAQLGLAGTLLGVDAVLDGALIGRDLTEGEILRLIEGRPARIVVGVVGGQGFLFGRGNQQISAAVIRRVGPDRIAIVAGADKILCLAAGALFVDTGDADLDARLSGFRRVQTAPGQALLCRVLA
jgi:predicted polyphosphate/ATP-dependent NAD kinase